MANPITGPVLAFASRLRFPTLFFLMLGLWLLNTVVLDPIPFVDEILMGLATLALASWKKGRQAKPGGELPQAVLPGFGKRLYFVVFEVLYISNAPQEPQEKESHAQHPDTEYERQVLLEIGLQALSQAGQRRSGFHCSGGGGA